MDISQVENPVVLTRGANKILDIRRYEKFRLFRKKLQNPWSVWLCCSGKFRIWGYFLRSITFSIRRLDHNIARTVSRVVITT